MTSAIELNYEVSKGGIVDSSTLYLYPGQLIVSVKPLLVSTILGSCIAVCLWDSTLKIGGVNHYLLPYRLQKDPLPALSETRFGNIAIEVLIQKMFAFGCEKENIRAKVFGGASVLKAFDHNSEHLGIKNFHIAKELLNQQRIPIVASDTGGNLGRKLRYQTGTGEAFISMIEPVSY